jgi:hypothetical protein
MIAPSTSPVTASNDRPLSSASPSQASQSTAAAVTGPSGKATSRTATSNTYAQLVDRAFADTSSTAVPLGSTALRGSVMTKLTKPWG